jgi:allene oxide cyclase
MFVHNCHRATFTVLFNLLGICLASADASADTSETLTFIEKSVHADGSVSYKHIDLGPSGPSVGDMIVFYNDVNDSSDKTLVGHDSGSCVKTALSPNDVYECAWTLSLADGQITAQGPFFDTSDSTFLAVTGGTGSYAGVRGEIKFQRRATSSPQYEMTYFIHR